MTNPRKLNPDQPSSSEPVRMPMPLPGATAGDKVVNPDDRMAVARRIMEKRRSALRELAQ